MKIPPPCIYCNAQEKWDSDHQRFENPVHDYSKHPGFVIREFKRMDSTELFSLPDAKVLDKLGNRREA